MPDLILEVEDGTIRKIEDVPFIPSLGETIVMEIETEEDLTVEKYEILGITHKLTVNEGYDIIAQVKMKGPIQKFLSDGQ